MRLQSWLLALALVTAAPSYAAPHLELKPSTIMIEGIAIADSAVLHAPDGKQVVLTTEGAGLRRKKFLGVPLKIYVAQLFTSEPEKFAATVEGALDSLDNIHEVALHISLKRSVSAAEMVGALNDGLAANKAALAQHGIQVDGNPDLENIKTTIASTGDLNAGSTAIFVLQRATTGNVLHYQAPNGSIHTMPDRNGLGRAVFSLWLGVSADQYLEALKAQLVTKPHPQQ